MDDLDDAIALVYAQPPSGFVAARTALVKELKAAERKHDAAAVAVLRRPTKLAWALGEAIRRAPEAGAAFFSAIDALAEPGGDLRRRTADLRSAVASLVAAVEDVDPGEATAAFLATAADPGATADLRRGRLAELPATGGFGGLGFGLDPGPIQGEAGHAAAEAGAPRGAVEEEDEDSDATGRAAAEAAERERREQEARAQAEKLAALESERDAAAAAEAAAAERVEAARAVLVNAQAELDQATRALGDARRASTEAATLLAEAEGSIRS